MLKESRLKLKTCSGSDCMEETRGWQAERGGGDLTVEELIGADDMAALDAGGQ